MKSGSLVVTTVPNWESYAIMCGVRFVPHAPKIDEIYTCKFIGEVNGIASIVLEEIKVLSSDGIEMNATYWNEVQPPMEVSIADIIGKSRQLLEVEVCR